MRLWYFICILFCFYSLNLLILDRYLISYIIVDHDNKLFDNKINFLLCTSFDQIKSNDQLFLSENSNPFYKLKNNLKKSNRYDESTKVSIYDFINYSITSIEFTLNEKSPFDIENSFTFQDFVCFQVEKFDLNFNHFIGKFANNYHIKLYAHSDYVKPYYYEAIYHEKSNVKSIQLKIFKQKVYHEKHLTRPKCLEPKEQYSLSRFPCLSKCFETHNVDFNIHNCKENKKYDLNRISRQFNYTETKSNHNQTIWNENLLIGLNKELFDKCINLCKSIYDCFYEVFNVVKERSDYYENVSSKTNEDKIITHVNTYFSYYSITDFLSQFFGLATLLTGTSFVNTTLLLINKLLKRSKLKNNLYLRLFFDKFQKILILFSILFVIYQSIKMISDYEYKSKYPNRTIVFYYNNDQFKVVICIPIEIILSINDNKFIKKNRNQEILNNFTINELKEKTNIDHRTLFNTSYAAFVLEPIISKVSKTTIFKYDEFNNQTVLTRCYEVNFIINLNRYESIIPSRYLFIKFNEKINHFRRIYAIENNQKLSTGLFEIKGEYHIGKLINSNLKSSRKANCEDYKKYENFKCESKNTCLNRCFSKKYFDKYNNVSIYSVIDDDILNLSLDRYFDNKKDNDIEKECNDLFQKDDCLNATFFEEWKPNYQYNEKYVLINLNYEKVIVKELDQSLVKVIFDIINLEIMFFSTNAIGLLSFIILLIKKKFQNIRIPKIITITICLIGFLIHNFSIFKNIIDEQLISSGHFIIRDELKLPNPIICFFSENELEIDSNHKFSFDYYDKNFYHKYYVNIFSELWYFNRTHINHFKNPKSTFSNSDIEINYFYYFKSICFEINLKLTFNTTDFYLLETRNLIGLTFNESFISKRKNHYPHFIFREEGTKDFSENFIFKAVNCTNEIMFELIEIEQEDNFELLKNPLSLFREKSNLNNVTKYLDEQVNEFRNLFNMSTLYIFLEDKDPNLIIDDDLFNQYFNQIQNKSDYNQFNSFNLKQKLYNTFNQQTKNNDGKSSFLFSVSLSKRLSRISNQDNYTKLLLNLLNTLSFWLDICVLDLYIYLIKIKFIFIKLNQILINLKFILKSYL